MLTPDELKAAREQLSQASALIETVRNLYLSAGCVEGARLLNDAHHLISDGVAALNKQIGQQPEGGSDAR